MIYNKVRSELQIGGVRMYREPVKEVSTMFEFDANSIMDKDIMKLVRVIVRSKGFDITFSHKTTCKTVCFKSEISWDHFIALLLQGINFVDSSKGGFAHETTYHPIPLDDDPPF